MRRSDLTLLAVAALMAAPLAAAPERVVSINLCTDQLAMLLAAPGQLVSVSWIARDPLSSAMAAEAMDWPVNHGQAEEVFMLHPDLVLAGTYTTRATVEMLERLGIPVIQFAPVNSLAETRQAILDTGAALGRDEAAAAMAADFDATLARIAATVPAGDGPTAALYFANGYTSGAGSLSGELMQSAGFRNITDDGPLAGRWRLALEELILAGPGFIVTGETYPGTSNAEELLRHPALAEIMQSRDGIGLSDADWVCGAPHVLRALDRLATARLGMEDRD
jgi:iron complex transport system substrate-binding protein